MTPERKEPGRFADERPQPDDQMAGSEGGSPDDPRFRETRSSDPREEVKKRASRYAMEDPEESGLRRRRESGGAPAREAGPPDEGREDGHGNESRPHSDEPIPEERDVPEVKEEPGNDQDDDAWSRIDRDR